MPIAIPVEPPFAGLLIDVVSSAVAILAGLTALLAGAAHYLSLLTGRTQRQIDIDTGIGFFAGMVSGALCVLMELFV